MGDFSSQQWLAVMGLLACLGVWLGMALGPARRQRLRARGRLWALALRQRLRNPLQARRARQEALDAIERARRTPKVEREGNVYRPDRFQNPGDGNKGRDKLH
jgi:hypothetical protein